MKKQKILMLGNSKLVIFGFRGELIKSLIKSDYEVVVSFPNGPFGEGQKISEEYGCQFIETPVNRHGKNPFQEMQLYFRYKALIQNVSPDFVLSYTVKCDVYGGIACHQLGVPFIPNITGLGKAIDNGGFIQKVTLRLYKAALKNAKCVFFQNDHDFEYFVDKGLLNSPSQVLPGSGVNLEKFKVLDYTASKKVVFTYIGRVMKAKGIEQFLDAARVIRASNKNAEFHICGYCEENYRKQIQHEEEMGNVVYHGLVSNVLYYEKISQCIVLPSFHPEGVSNVLLEAAACARPIITTDHPGCRDAVDDTVSGFLVKTHSSIDLIHKMREFLSLSNTQRKIMGLNGRKKMEKEFDRNIVVNAYLEVLNATDLVESESMA